MYEDRNGTDIYYYYDSYGTPVSIRYYEPDGTSYRFYLATNQLGDVIGLYNTSGNLVVKYEYDAWGNILKTTNANGDSLNSLSQKWSDINPFRYRGYYYDSETGLYYLNSRYYDSETGRFVNADQLIADIGGELLGHNTFAYCFNNPINMVDINGDWPSWNDLKQWGNDIVDGAKKIYNDIKESLVINLEWGFGYGAEFEAPYNSVSATANINPVCVQITEDEIKWYSSLNLSFVYQWEGVEVGPEYHFIFDWKTLKIHKIDEDFQRFSDLEYGASFYKGQGGSVSVGFNELY